MGKHTAVKQKNTRKRAAPRGGKRRSPLRAPLVILALILAAALILGAVLLIAPLTERVDDTVVPGSADWMARLGNEKPLNEIVLPGSHNSAARYVEHAFFAKCQTLGIGEQLEAGVRYLDLRLDMDGTRFKLMHGPAECRTSLLGGALTLDELLADCYAFLDAHPTETVLLAVAQEPGGDEIRSFQLLLDAYVREAPERWLLTDRIPTLGEARGKLVLLRRYEDEAGLLQAAGLSLLWRDQGGSEDTTLGAEAAQQRSYLLYVQDRYEYAAKDKWEAFLAGVRSTQDGAVSLNFLSTKGEAKYGHPYEFAKSLNQKLMEAEDSALGGWIVTDFVSATLAERIYRLNF